MSRRFLCACVGSLLLTLGFSDGPPRALAQLGSIEGAKIAQYGGDVTCVVAGQFIIMHSGGDTIVLPASVPAGARVIATSQVQSGSTPYAVVLESGDVYDYWSYDPRIGAVSEWRLRGNIVTPATRIGTESWGSVKARYRR